MTDSPGASPQESSSSTIAASKLFNHNNFDLDSSINSSSGVNTAPHNQVVLIKAEDDNLKRKREKSAGEPPNSSYSSVAIGNVTTTTGLKGEEEYNQLRLTQKLEQDWKYAFKNPITEAKFVEYTYRPAGIWLPAIITAVVGSIILSLNVIAFHADLFRDPFSQFFFTNAMWQKEGTETVRYLNYVLGGGLLLISVAQMLFAALSSTKGRNIPGRVLELFWLLADCSFLLHGYASDWRYKEWCQPGEFSLLMRDDFKVDHCRDFIDGYLLLSLVIPIILPVRLHLWFPPLILLMPSPLFYRHAVMGDGASFFSMRTSDAGWIAVTLISFLACVRLEKRARRQYKQFAATEHHASETQRTKEALDGLLTSMLPPSVLKRIVAGEAVVDSAFATIVFSDMAGFTAWCAKRKAKDVVQMVNAMYTMFDKGLKRYEIEKIKTIGDAYFAVCGLPDPNPLHALHVCAYAKFMHSCLQRMKARNPDHTVSIRVGVHTGNVCGGLVGTQRSTYDVFGGADDIGQKMEQLAPVGKVLISQRTFLELKKLGLLGFPQEEDGELLPSDAHPDDTVAPATAVSVQDSITANTVDGEAPPLATYSLPGVCKLTQQDAAVQTGEGPLATYVLEEFMWLPPSLRQQTTQFRAFSGDAASHRRRRRSSTVGRVGVEDEHSCNELLAHISRKGYTEIMNKFYFANYAREENLRQEAVEEKRRRQSSSVVAMGLEEGESPTTALLAKAARESFQVDDGASHHTDGHSLHSETCSRPPNGHSGDHDGNDSHNPVDDHEAVDEEEEPPNRDFESCAAPPQMVDQDMTLEEYGTHLAKASGKVTFTFDDPIAEKECTEFIWQRFPTKLRTMSSMMGLFIAVLYVIQLSTTSGKDSPIVHVLMVLNMFFQVGQYFSAQRIHPYLGLALCYTGCQVLLVALVLAEDSVVTVDLLYVAFTYLLFSSVIGIVGGYPYLLQALLNIIFFMVPQLIVQITFKTLYIHHLTAPVVMFIAWGIGLRAAEKNARQLFIHKKRQDLALHRTVVEHEKVSELLGRMVPKFIVEELTTWFCGRRTTQLAVSFPCVGILFFRAPSLADELHSMVPKHIMEQLSTYVTICDRVLEIYEDHCTKLKIIGDILVVASGLEKHCALAAKEREENAQQTTNASAAAAAFLKKKQQQKRLQRRTRWSRGRDLDASSTNSPAPGSPATSLGNSRRGTKYATAAGGTSLSQSNSLAASFSAQLSLSETDGTATTAPNDDDHQHLHHLVLLAMNLAATVESQFLDFNAITTFKHNSRVCAGLHCGPVTGGVIGTDRIVYDVFGDTVNTASRVMTTAVRDSESGGGVWASKHFSGSLHEWPGISFGEAVPRQMKGKGTLYVVPVDPSLE